MGPKNKVSFKKKTDKLTSTFGLKFLKLGFFLDILKAVTAFFFVELIFFLSKDFNIPFLSSPFISKFRIFLSSKLSERFRAYVAAC
jgi:hypothetical protein